MAVRVLDLELAGALELPPVSARYERARLLVRRHGAPLGYVHVENSARALAPPELARTVVRELAGAAWAELVADSRPAARQGTNGGSELETISVVVCTRDRPDDLDLCLAALAEQRYPLYEVVVVDNAARGEATKDVAERWGARYVVERRPGLDWARNRGVAEAGGAIVAFTDDDARPDSGWLGAIAAGFAAPEVQAITGPVVPAELETRAQLLFEDAYGGMGKGFRLRLHSRRGRSMTYFPSAYGAGCNMAFRRAALERVGGFDEALDVGTATGGGGDLDMFQRVIESDGVIAYRPAAIVRHVHRRTARQLRRQLFDNGRGYGATLWAALRRARGVDRLRVVYGFAFWLYWWHLRRIGRRLLRREQLPLHLLLLELAGTLLGPLSYALARRRARRLARTPR